MCRSDRTLPNHKKPVYTCTNPMCRQRLSRGPPQQNPVCFILLSSGSMSRASASPAKFFDKLRSGKIGECITKADCGAGFVQSITGFW